MRILPLLQPSLDQRPSPDAQVLTPKSHECASPRSIHANSPAIVKRPRCTQDRCGRVGAPAWVIMQSSLADLVDAWHDFDVLIGTAAATLIGLMFVAASIGASVYTEKDRAAMEAFISPTVVHFSAVLFVAILSLVPSHAWPTLAGLLALWGDPRRNLFGQSLAPTLYPPPLQCRHRRSPVLRADLGIGLSPSPARRLRPVPAIAGGPRSARRRADHASPRRHPQRLGHDALDRDPRSDAEHRRPRGRSLELMLETR